MTTTNTEPGYEQHFRQRLKAARKALGLTQADLALRATSFGFPTQQQSIARIEANDRGIGLDEAGALSLAVGMSLLDMLAPENAPEADVDRAIREHEREAQTAALRFELAASEERNAAAHALLRQVGAVLSRKVDTSDLKRNLNELIPRAIDAPASEPAIDDEGDDEETGEPPARARTQRAPARQPRKKTKKGAGSGKHQEV